MKISETGAYRPTSKLKKATRTSDGVSFGDFMTDGAGATEGSQAPTDVASLSGINPLLSMQEISDDESQKRQAIHHGQKQLQMLERLRDAILMGRVPPHILRDLERSIAEQRHRNFDPRLKDILDEVDLRVAVELAKLDVAQRANVRS